MKSSLWVILFFLCANCLPAAEHNASLVLACSSANDLYQVLRSNHIPCVQYDSPAAAVQNAAPGAGVMVLADGYPKTPTPLTPAILTQAAQKKLRLFVEFPAYLPSQKIGKIIAADRERGVITSTMFGDTLKPMSIVLLNGCSFVETAAANPLIVLAQVAGFDRAVYGLKDTTAHPLLFELPGRSVLVATTKLSQFVTARYGPHAAWQSIWRFILNYVQPGLDTSRLDWISPVHPAYKLSDQLPADAARQAIIKGIDWHSNARMLVHPAWTNQLAAYDTREIPVGPRPDASLPAGDGSEGLLEGFASGINSDGSQFVRWWLRSDSNGESTLAFALRAQLDGDPRSRQIAGNLADWVWFKSGLQHGGDPANSMYGLLGWGPNGKFRTIFYGDNDIKAILGGIGTAALLKTDRWDEALVKNILANYRTTGALGFRQNSFTGPMPADWKKLFKEKLENPRPHYQAWVWSSYLWLYDKTGYKPLLERTREAIARMMELYPDGWFWANGFQQERGRMLLPLAWLVRVDDRPLHRAWLKRLAQDMARAQDASGAIREELGELSHGAMPPPLTNTRNKNPEASIIMKNGDPVADLLYTCNFTFFGLHEAAAATGDPLYRAMEDRLADFLLSIQVRSASHPELDGAWFRAFDFKRWEYFASNADHYWGPTCVEAGWTQGWITTTLALRELNQNLWDLSKGSGIKRAFEKIRPLMLPDEK